jgi:hypothetical protein
MYPSRPLAILGLLLLAAATASAFDLGATIPTKPAGGPHAPVPDPDVIRQGGDTIADATPINALPYSDTGTTAGYTDDYDEVCPYTGSTSPDVVYTITPDQDITVFIDLFGSTYDTKLYVYDEAMNLVACNDDFYPDYVSRLDRVDLLAGVQYSIIIDGYGGDFGDYVLTMDSFVPCVIDCPAGAELEGEPPLVDGYEDAFNGGCQFPQFGYNFSTITQPVFCGVSGWYYTGFLIRDNDYFEQIIPASGVFELTADAEYATYVFQITWCDNLQMLQQIQVGPCQPGSMTIVGQPGETFWLFIIPTSFEGPVNEYNYVIESNLGTVATTPRSWSAVKGLFDQGHQGPG